MRKEMEKAVLGSGYEKERRKKKKAHPRVFFGGGGGGGGGALSRIAGRVREWVDGESAIE